MVKISKREWLAFLLVIIAGLVRFLIGLQSPDALSVDSGFRVVNLGIIGLMSKHALELGEFPYFFWGQNWFGGLEAMLHGIAFWFFGVTPWAMRVVPLLLFMLFCMITFLITRDLFDETTGLFSVAWCIVAPLYLTKLTIVPQTHYLETVVFGSLILWLALRLTKAKTVIGRRLLYISFGLWAGLSWWVTPLIAYYLAATAVFIFLKERGRSICYGILLSGPAFILGMLPMLIYYARDPNSHLLAMGNNFKISDFLPGLQRMITMAGPDLLGFHDYEKFGFWAPWAAGAFYLYALGYLLIKTGKNFYQLFSFRSRENGSQGLLMVFLLAIIVIYCTSENALHKYAPRYLLSICSLFPIVCAAAIWAVPRKVRWFTVPIFFLFFCAQGWCIGRWAYHEVPAHENQAKKVIGLVDYLKAHHVDRAYAFEPGYYEMTFLAKESIIFAAPYQEKYSPYELALDVVPKPVFVAKQHSLLTPVLKLIGGSCEEDAEGDYQIYRNFKEAPRCYHQIDSQEMNGIASTGSIDIPYTLDRNFATAWRSAEGKTEGMWLQYDLGKERTMGMIRLLNQKEDTRTYALDTTIKVSLDGKIWQEVIPHTNGDFYYWSGPRIYFWGWEYRWEARFGPIQARFVRIKQFENSNSKWKVAEAYFYEDIGERKATDAQDESNIVKRIKILQLKYVYANRWMSAKVREGTAGQIQTIKPTYVRKQKDSHSQDQIIKWNPLIGFICEDADADTFQKDVSIWTNLKREDYGRWTLFYSDALSEPKENLDDFCLWWTGMGIINLDKKFNSEQLRHFGEKSLMEGKLNEAVIYFKEALACYPNHQGVLKLLNETLFKLKHPEAEHYLQILKEQTQVQHAAPILFKGGIEFLGYSMESETVKPGQSLKITYYWKLHQDPGNDVSVFVHMEGQNKLIQDDHIFLEHEQKIWPTLDNEIFHQERLLNIPKETLDGEYKIGIGLYNPITGKRWKVKKTSLPIDAQKTFIGSLKVS